jgi:hypothetical protein
LILAVLACLFIPYSGEVSAAAVPTFGVVSTNPGTSVTIQTADFPENQTFTVRVGDYGTLAIGGVVVGTTNSGPGGVFQATYNIPDALKDRMYLAVRMDSSTGYYYSYSWFVNKSGGTLPPSGMVPGGINYGVPGYGAPGSFLPGFNGIPTFSINSVDPDKTVTIQTNNFPPNQDFIVRMGNFGTLALGGIVVATTNSGNGGSFLATYTIPDALKGQQLIAIRTDSTSGINFSYNWFHNDVNGTVPGTPGTVFTGVVPTFSISDVDRDNKVTIKAFNFPPSQSFTVRMGPFGTAAIGGTVVATTDSGAGGSFEATYTIPDWLKGSTRIAIRMDSPTGFYFAYNWFWNNTVANSNPGGTINTGFTGIPTFSIQSVTQDGKVTIVTSPFPANQTFTVRMGMFGTAAVGGTVVGTLDSGNGNSQTASFVIPDWLKGSSQIAIRMDNASGFYFAYNWFWNNTTN